MSLFQPSVHRATGTSGSSLSGATWTFYITGTSTPATVYADSGLATPLSNPVVADSGGKFANIYLDDEVTYRAVLKDSGGTTIKDIDPFNSGASVSEALFSGMADISTGGADTIRTLGKTSAGIGSAEYIKDAAVDAAHVTANPHTSFISDDGHGYRLSPNQIITPYMFGAIGGDDTFDDSPGWQRMYDFLEVNKVLGTSFGGDFYFASGVTMDGTVSYLAEDVANTTMELDFAGCRITATAAMDVLMTIKNMVVLSIAGGLHLRGTNWAEDTHTLWTVNVGLLLDNCHAGNAEAFYFEGFAYAGLDFGRNPSQSNSFHLGKIEAKRCGSGAPSGNRSLSANWSGATRSGSYGSSAQRTTITVGSYPNSFISENSSGSPLRALYVEINGRLHFVYNIDTGASTIQVFPWIPTSVGTTGSLKWHYGGAVVCRGNDNNVIGAERISAIACGTALALECLYGGSYGSVLAEHCGAWMRLAGAPTSQVFGGAIDHRYCESNTFNLVSVGASTAKFKIQSSSGDIETEKDVTLFEVLGTGEVFSNEGLVGVTMPADEGSHKRVRRFNNANITLDLNRPATYLARVIQTNATTDNAAVTLAAVDANFVRLYGYGACRLCFLGRQASGAPAGNIVFTPPSGQTINGGAADATATFSTFTGPVDFAIHCDTSASPNAWTIRVISGT